MMQLSIVSLFPDMFHALHAGGVIARAFARGHARLDYFNPRDYSDCPYQSVDDRPYGGGSGMLMRIEPLQAAIQAAKRAQVAGCRVIHVSPQGKPFSQAVAARMAKEAGCIFVASRYEGLDERLVEAGVIDEEWSIGDYVISGGELAIMVMIDAIVRLMPGVLNDAMSSEQDSFGYSGLLDYPHYTRPGQSEIGEVPSVLFSGDHAAIARWRLKQSLGRTWLKRPDLIQQKRLTVEEQCLLDEFIHSYQAENSEIS